MTLHIFSSGLFIVMYDNAAETKEMKLNQESN